MEIQIIDHGADAHAVDDITDSAPEDQRECERLQTLAGVKDTFTLIAFKAFT